MRERWTAEKAAAWYENDVWRAGCNYLPGTAMEEKRARGEVLGPGDPIPEPGLWFHDILRMDGTPYDERETEFLRKCLKG